VATTGRTSLDCSSHDITGLDPVEVSGRLFEKCQGIFSKFNPDNDFTLVYPISKRFWGAVDEITRVSLES
jgi:hypothetical protein